MSSPEMKSTGEVIGMDEDYALSLYKGLVAAGYSVPSHGVILATLADKTRKGLLLKEFAELDSASLPPGTAALLAEQAFPPRSSTRSAKTLNTLTSSGEGGPGDQHRQNKILSRQIKMRRATVEFRIPCLTSLDTAWARFRC